VAGYGDTIPMNDSKPEEEVNRRVTVMLKINTEQAQL
jgi:flagellar motor protein MotB